MRRAARRLAVVALVLVASTHLPTAAADAWQPSPGAKTIKLADACPGNLLVNGDMESPRPGTLASQVPGHGNSRWGWYNSKVVPGWYPACARTDWETKTSLNYMEIHRNSVAVAPEGGQYMELLPNGTGVACQDVMLVPGQNYKLTFMYGFLKTYAWRPPNIGKFEVFNTKAVAGIRDATKKYPRGAPFARNGVIGDRQGFTVIKEMDTTTHKDQWQKYETTFRAPSGKVTVMFTTTARPKQCGTCGSLLDAVCLQKA